MLAKNCHANARMATVLIDLLWREYWPRFSSPCAAPGFSPIRSQREGQLVIEDPVNRGHCQRDTLSRRYSYEEPYSVLKRRHLATCCTARL